MNKVVVGLVLSVVMTSVACAADSPKKNKVPNPWKGSTAGFGWVSNSGNTDGRNINGSGKLQYTYNQWVWAAQGNYQYAWTKKSGSTANRFYSELQTQYDFTKHNFTYAKIEYTDNKFDGYDYIFNESIGYGYRLPSMPKDMTLDVYGGPGFQQTKVTDGESKNMPSLQAGMNYVWTITNKTDFTQMLEATTSSQNTRFVSKTSLVTTLSDHLGFEVSFLAIKDSKPQPNKKSLNTTTTLQLIYNF